MNRALRLTALAAVASALTTCATNPATGERQLMLLSESQEIAMGREADPEIVASMGLYENPALQSYVSDLGRRMAAQTTRPNLPWTFRVLDDPVVNAFALPGGYVYITRGILAHFESEAQLASVLGHEIGHVTARHSAEQMSRAQLAQVGLVAGAIFTPERFQDLIGVAGVGMQLMFLKFSRSDESQADALGFRYLMRLRYDPHPMADVFTMLERVSQASGGGGVPEWLSTHPNPGNRRERIEQMIGSAGPVGTTVNRDDYLARLDGLVYGEDPRQGYFEGSLFLHPTLRFRIEFPNGWRTVNQRDAVAAGAPDESAVMQLSLAEQPSADLAARAFFGQQGITGSLLESSRINGLPAVSGEFDATSAQTPVHGAAVFVEYGGTTYQILGYAATVNWPTHRSLVLQTFRSFAPETRASVLNVKPRRLAVVTLERAMTLRDFAARYPSVVSLDELALINQVDADTRFTSGARVKRVVQ